MNAMDLFAQSLTRSVPPLHFTEELRALWLAAHGEFEVALSVVARSDGANAAWVRGHIYRSMGNVATAQQWYGAVSKQLPDQAPDRERSIIANILMANIG